MSDYQCPRCAADPRPEHFGDDRRCAFDADGNFTPDNWNCATIDALIGFDRHGSQIVDGDDERCEVTPTYIDDGTDEVYGGWIVTTRYKRRGQTDSAIYVGQFHPPQPLTLAFTERAIQSRASREEWRSKYGMPDESKQDREGE